MLLVGGDVIVPAVMRAFPAHAVSEVTRWEGLGGDTVSGRGWEVMMSSYQL